MRSLQFLVSSSLRNRAAEIYRVNIDIADYKAQRAQRLVAKLKAIFDEVVNTGAEHSLEPMNAADRRVVHQAVADYAELTTRSEGEGRDRHIIISKTS